MKRMIKVEASQNEVGLRRHSTSPPCRNLVDGLPHDCHTETLAKPGRLGPAKNSKLMENFIELTTFCITFDKKTHRIRCQAYDKDQYGCR